MRENYIIETRGVSFSVNQEELMFYKFMIENEYLRLTSKQVLEEEDILDIQRYKEYLEVISEQEVKRYEYLWFLNQIT